MIITGRENVYYAEVEAALSSHPTVLEVAVFDCETPGALGEHLAIPDRPVDKPGAGVLAASRGASCTGWATGLDPWALAPGPFLYPRASLWLRGG
jgi:acyl-CoA synthetase (AMP-forming)/AMP-acid ligase II